MADLLERISAFADRAKQLEEMLARPEVASNPTEYRRMARDLATLRPAAEAALTYRRVQAEIEGARGMLIDGDTELRKLAEGELAQLEAQRTELELEIRRLLLPQDPDDAKDVILEIRAGAGGDEAALLAQLPQRFEKVVGRSDFSDFIST
jgi:peptide chain release factor 1